MVKVPWPSDVPEVKCDGPHVLKDGIVAYVKVIERVEGKIWVGSREGYNGPSFDENKVLSVIADYQRNAPENLRGTVRVTKTAYIFKNYCEDGFEIGCWNYPRFPRSVGDFAAGVSLLAVHLLVELKQNRVGGYAAGASFLIEREDAEKTHKEEKTDGCNVATLGGQR